MACLGASVYDKPIGLVPCLSWTSASLTLTKGVLTGAINWDLLQKQYTTYNAYKDEVVRMIEFEESAHQAGVDFAQHMDRLAEIEEMKRERWWSNVQSMQKTDSKEVSETTLTSLLPSKSSFLPQVNFFETSLPKSAQGKEDEKTFSMLPKIIRSDASDSPDSLHREAVYFMRGIMDECTHLRNYDVPYDPSLVYIVVAENDAYQPREGISALPDLWPGANMRYIEGQGHVASYLFKQNVFRQAIYDSIDKYVEKYMQKT